MVALLEREEQLSRLERSLADCLARSGRAVLIEGPVGTGKTELLRVLAERATARGLRFLSAVCSPAERALPFGAAAQLLRAATWPHQPSPRTTFLLDAFPEPAAGPAENGAAAASVGRGSAHDGGGFSGGGAGGHASGSGAGRWGHGDGFALGEGYDDGLATDGSGGDGGRWGQRDGFALGDGYDDDGPGGDGGRVGPGADGAGSPRGGHGPDRVGHGDGLGRSGVGAPDALGYGGIGALDGLGDGVGGGFDSAADRFRPGGGTGDDVTGRPPSPRLLRACHELAATLLAAAAETPLLIGVDDLRHADGPSLHLLLHLVRRLPQHRVLLVLTDASDAATSWPAHRRFRAELARHRHVHRLRLAPLSPTGARRLVADALGAADAARYEDELLAAGGGNPLLLHALLDDLRHPDVPEAYDPPYGESDVPEAYDPPYGEGPEAYDPPPADLSEMYELHAHAPETYDPPYPNSPQWYDLSHADNPQPYHSPKPDVPQPCDRTHPDVPEAYDPPHPDAPQPYDPPHPDLPQPYDPPHPDLPQPYDPPHVNNPRSYDLPPHNDRGRTPRPEGSLRGFGPRPPVSAQRYSSRPPTGPEEYGRPRHAAAPGYGLALLSCLHRAEPDVLRVVRGLAVLGDDVAASDLARLVDVPARTARDVLCSLTIADLLDAGSFRHPAARAAVLADLPEPERAALHLRAARLAYDRGAPALTVAAHLLAADRPPVPWSAAVLAEAAEQALGAEHPHQAAEFLRLAHRASPAPAPALLSRLAQAEWRLTPALPLRHLSHLAAAAHAGRLPLSDSLALIPRLLWHGRSDDATRVLDSLLSPTPPESPADAAGNGTSIPAGPPATQHPAARSAARVRPAPASEPASSTRAERSAVGRGVAAWMAYAYPGVSGSGSAGQGPDPRAGASAVLAEALVRGRSAEVVGRAEQALAETAAGSGDPWDEETALVAVRVLVQADRLGSAVEWSDRLLAAAERREGATEAAFHGALRAEVALHQGDMAAATAYGRVALDRLTPAGWGVAAGLPLGTMALAATRAGEHEEAARLLARPVGGAMAGSLHGLHHRFARAHHRLAAHHTHAALADFLACGELLCAWGLDAAELLPWRSDAAEACLRLDDGRQARRLLHEQLARPGTSRTRGPALRLLAATLPAARRPPLLSEAVGLAETSGDRFEQVRVLADLSRAHRALGDRRRARLLLRQALHVATAHGMRPLVRELLSVSADISPTTTPAEAGPPVSADVGPTAASAEAGPPGAAALTGSERRVASLAVFGYTNREIALRLYVTPSTVEQHLTRVFRKLGIRRREDLPAELWSPLPQAG